MARFIALAKSKAWRGWFEGWRGRAAHRPRSASFARLPRVELLESRTLLSVAALSDATALGVLSGSAAATGDQVAAGSRWIDFNTAGASQSGQEPGVTLRNASPQEIVGEVSLGGAWLEPLQYGNRAFARLTLPGSGYTDAVGQPELPVIRQWLTVPDGATLEPHVTSQPTTWSLAQLGIDEPLAPVQAPASKSADPAAQPLALDTAVYSTDAELPASPIRLTEAGRQAGQRLVLVELAPIGYDPAAQTVTVYDTLSFTLDMKGAPGQSLVAALSGLPGTSDLATSGPAAAAATTPRLLIIVNNSLLAGTPLEDFVAHKNDLGWIVDVEPTSVAGTTNTAIRSYIQGRYNNPATRPDAVLLVGDTNLVPQFVSTGADAPDTDLYYGCMDPGDDWTPEIPVGRFSVANTTQLAAVVNKTIDYETAPNAQWMNNAAFLASNDSYDISEGTHNYVIDTYMDPWGYTSDKLYAHTYSATTQQVRNALNAGTAWAVYSGHGATTYWADGPQFTQTDVQGLSNAGMYPFVASFACWTGRYSTPECFAETWQRQANKGGVEVLASSAETYWGNDDYFEKALFAAIYADGQTTIGNAILQAKLAYEQHYGVSDSLTREYFEMYNLLGDPTVQLRGLDFNIYSPSSLVAYRNEFYQHTMTAYRGTAPYTWSVTAGALPDGLALDPATGVISGAPTQLENRTCTIQVRDAANQTVSRQFHLAVVEPLAITTPVTLPAASVGTPYSATIQAQNGTAPYAWSLTDVGMYTESDPGSRWLGGGTAQNWHADDDSWSLALPWAFPFYGQAHTSVSVSSNGYLSFDAKGGGGKSKDLGKAFSSGGIAPLFADLVTDVPGDDIFVTENSSYVAVRWQAHTYSETYPVGSYPVNVEAVLYRDGSVRFNYGPAHSTLPSVKVIGIFAGDGVNYTISSRSGDTSIPAYVSSEFTYAGPLPPGLTWDPATPTINGTPTQGGTYSIGITVTDASDPAQSASRQFSLSVGGVGHALGVQLPPEVWEGQGTLTSAGTVTISSPLSTSLVVALASSDASELLVPPTVTIPAGALSAPFDLFVQDDAQKDGRQSVRVTATATGASGGIETMTVGDNELDHYGFDTIASPQHPNAPFSVTVEAEDVNGEMIQDYSGPLSLSAAGDNGPLALGSQSQPVKAANDGTPYDQISLPSASPVGLGVYHSYETLTADLVAYARAHPDICRLVSIGTSVEGRQLWAMKITSDPAYEEDKPEVKYIGTIHGDEPVGEEMCLYFIDYLLNNYGKDSRVTSLVDSEEIWILPLMNPDGAAVPPVGQRENADYVDLNRAFPEGSPPTPFGNVFDGPALDTTGREPEVADVMQWSADHSFTLAANFHTGSLVVNYPYDNDGLGSVNSPSPDDALFQYVSEAYSSHNLPMWNSPRFTHGITNGAAWYSMSGGMQDWDYRYLSGNEVTIELSNVYRPAESNLAGLWNDNRDSMLSYFETADQLGVRGAVTDAATGSPVYAKVTVAGNSQPVFSDPDVGDYHRMLLPGTYTLTFSAPGYVSQTFAGVVVQAGGTTGLDVQLVPQITDGWWTGTVTFGSVDTNVVLTASDSQAHAGLSNAFDVVAGALDHFAVDPISSPQQIGTAFPVTIRAVDANDFPLTDFNGTVSLSGEAGTAATPVEVGTGAIDLPWANSSSAYRTQAIYLHSELGGPQTFSGLALNFTDVPDQTLQNWTIRMKHTSLGEFTEPGSWESSGWTTVYQADATISAPGWVTFNFSTPLVYDGTDNLMVDFSYNDDTPSYWGSVASTETAATRVIVPFDSGQTSDPLGWSGNTPTTEVLNYLPNARFVVSTPVPVTPSVTDPFTAGVWTGSVTVQQAAGQMVLTVRGAGSISGQSNPFAVGSAMAGRYVFYNNSYFDGNNAAANAADDNAVATDKAALLPGGTASFANYTSFSRGINGIMVDIAGLPGSTTLGAADFAFRLGNNSDPASWTAAPAPSSVTVRPGAGTGGSDRVTILWADGAIKKEWLQVRVLADANTALPQDDVFYFGNAVGECGNSTVNFVTDTFDISATRTHRLTVPGSALVTNAYDFNRDGKVDTFDISICRVSRTTVPTALQRITVPVGAKSKAGAIGGAVASAAAQPTLASAIDTVLAREPATSNAVVKAVWLWELGQQGPPSPPAKKDRSDLIALDAVLAAQ